MMRLFLTLLLIAPMLLAPASGMASAPVPDALTADAGGKAARAWSNVRKRCGMTQSGQQQGGRCVVDLIAILSSTSVAVAGDRSFHGHAVDAGWQALAPRPLTKPPRA